MHQTPSVDALQMPYEALAAYWLSIGRLTESKRGKSVLAGEIDGTGEPFIRHVLELMDSGLEHAQVRHLMQAKRGQRLSSLRTAFGLMRIALVGIASGENPRITLVRLAALFAADPIDETKAMSMAQGVADSLGTPGTNQSLLLTVDHTQPPDRLIVKLLFYCLQARRRGKEELHEYLPHRHSPLFGAGLALVADGFDAAFLMDFLSRRQAETLLQARRKMAMSVEMAMAIRKELGYEDVFLIGRSFMP